MLIRRCPLAVVAMAVSALFSSARPASAQIEPIEGFTPAALQPGAPAGSFPLSGFEQVVPYSGAIHFTLPLLQFQGRGRAGALLALPLQPKWHVTWREHLGEPLPRYSILGMPRGKRPDYGYSRVTGRRGVHSLNFKFVTRFTFATPDGTEYELRDAVYDGEPRGETVNRGRVFVTSDGTAATFLLDADFIDQNLGSVRVFRSGYLFLRDGTRFRVASDGTISWMQDRTGNRVSFFYQPDAAGNPRVVQIVDSLNRSVTVAYGDDAVGPTTDTIQYKGFGRAPRTITIQWALLSALFTPGQGYVVQTRSQLFPGLAGQDLHNPRLPASVMLPNGRSYRFTYNPYGELEEITLPTDAVIRYEYAAGLLGGAASGYFQLLAQGHAIYRRAVVREVYEDGLTLTSRTTVSRPETLGVGNVTTLGYVDVQTLEPDGARLSLERHFYEGPGAALSLLAEPSDYTGWTHGQETKVEGFATDGVTLLRRTTHEWGQGGIVSWWTGPIEDAPQKNPRLFTTTTELPASPNPSRVSKQTFLYDQYNNRTEVSEYDFGAGAPGPLRRRTTTTYVTSLTTGGVLYWYDLVGQSAVAESVIHIRDLPFQVAVYEGASTLRALTTYDYDQYDGPNNAPLVTYPDIVGLDPAYAIGTKLTRGNATKQARWWNSDPAGVVEVYRRYDVAGNPVSERDGRGNQTTYAYDDRFGAPDGEARANTRPPELPTGSTRAFASLVTNPKGHTTYSQVDYYLGRVVDFEDANGVVSSVSYADPLDRPTALIAAANQAVPPKAQTVFSYNDLTRVITTAQDKNAFGDQLLKTQSVYDRLGRVVESWMLESGSDGILTLREYDGLGRVSAVSNPFRPASETAVFTSTAYDGQGRVLATTTPDGATTTTGYSGDTTTVTDPAGKTRRSRHDGLGRLVELTESPGGLNYLTSYQYDVFDNVSQVTQGGQTRSFTYDSLGRLKTAANPESGTVSYERYDANGNLLEKRDARVPQVVVMQGFDALDRVLTRSYSDGTPAVTYAYDGDGVPGGIAFSKGRLTRASTNVSRSDFTSFDALGRVKASEQTTAGRAYGMQYTYDLAGNLKTETYPSSRVITISYDNAGRVALVSGVDGIYADQISYTPHGAAAGFRLGNSVAGAELWEHSSFNSRLQPVEIALGTVSGLSNVFRLQFKYGDDKQFESTTNNGNVTWHETRHTVSAASRCWTQGYGYDAVNRLGAIAEVSGTVCNVPVSSVPTTCTVGSGVGWCQGYAYDRFGNRAVPTYVVHPPSPLAPTALSQYNAANNRILSSSYDGAGNQTGDLLGRTFGYDGENRQRSFTASGVGASYEYDGDGRRVKSTVNGQTAVYVYDAFDKLVGEYGGAATAGVPPGRRYLTVDHLGSTRLVTDQGRNVIARHDFAPFGEELPASLNVRTIVPDYAADDKVRQKFTGKERDAESALDYFGARYASGAQGRFASVDPVLSLRPTLMDPQRWNRYAYVRQNPLRYVDTTGEEIEDAFRFLSGVANAVGSNFFLGAGRVESPNTAYQVGQLAGDLGSIALGSAETQAGLGIAGIGTLATPETGPVGAGAALLGVSVAAHGASAAGAGTLNAAKGFINLMSQDTRPGGGVQVTSKTLYNRRGIRVDVENPNPAERAGQVHIQIGNEKYIYDPLTGKFKDAPPSVQKLLEDKNIKQAIEKGITRYLGLEMP